MNELTIVESTAVELYENNALRDFVAKLKADMEGIVTDVTTEKGRKEIASLAHKVARTKTKLDEMGKDLGEEYRDKLNKINAERKFARDELDALKEKVRKPLTDFEQREKERIERHAAKVQQIRDAEAFDGTSAEIKAEIERIEKVDTSDMDEFQTTADGVKKAVVGTLTERMNERRKREDEAAELERLRKEKEERERKEREERIAREAAEKAKREAEEAEKRRLEEAERKRKEEEERRKAEEEQRIAREKAERERIEREREEERRKLKEAEERAKQAAIEERKRIEREAEEKAEKEAAERAKREADKKHRERLLCEIAEDVGNYGSPDRIAKAIICGEIRHVTANI